MSVATSPARERVIGGITIRFINGNAFSAYLANYVMGPSRDYLYSSALMVTVLPMRALVILYSEAFISFAFCAITASAESSVVPVAVTLCADALNAATEKREAVKIAMIVFMFIFQSVLIVWRLLTRWGENTPAA